MTLPHLAKGLARVKSRGGRACLAWDWWSCLLATCCRACLARGMACLARGMACLARGMASLAWDW